MSPIIKQFDEKNIKYFIIHTNQHYSKNLDEVFFNDLKLSKPKINLNIGSGNHGEQSGRMLEKIEKILLKKRPGIVFVHGDTNTALAGALAAVKLGIKVAHVEAGLRSYDKTMPEEINRVVIDHISDFLFAPNQQAKKNLLKEGVGHKKIFIVGTTIVDAVINHIKLIDEFNFFKKINIKPKSYFLATIHRQENVDNKEKLSNILFALNSIQKKYDMPVVYPMHPRAKKMIELFGIDVGNVKVIDPVGYLDFLALMKNSAVILTDSGGIQEEACILHIPCITLRDNTERPETLIGGGNVVVGTNPKKIFKEIDLIMRGKKMLWLKPFGSGNSSQKIVSLIKKYL